MENRIIDPSLDFKGNNPELVKDIVRRTLFILLNNHSDAKKHWEMTVDRTKVTYAFTGSRTWARPSTGYIQFGSDFTSCPQNHYCFYATEIPYAAFYTENRTQRVIWTTCHEWSHLFFNDGSHTYIFYLRLEKAYREVMETLGVTYPLFEESRIWKERVLFDKNLNEIVRQPSPYQSPSKPKVSTSEILGLSF